MFDKELCKTCCHWYDPGNHCDSTEEFCINNDHFSPKTFSITELMSKPKIENVIFNDPATIVFWQDGTKTVVKCHDGVFDPEKGLAMAISKKALGNKYDYYEEFEKWLPKEEKFDGGFDKKDVNRRKKYKMTKKYMNYNLQKYNL